MHRLRTFKQPLSKLQRIFSDNVADTTCYVQLGMVGTGFIAVVTVFFAPEITIQTAGMTALTESTAAFGLRDLTKMQNAFSEVVTELSRAKQFSLKEVKSRTGWSLFQSKKYYIYIRVSDSEVEVLEVSKEIYDFLLNNTEGDIHEETTIKSVEGS